MLYQYVDSAEPFLLIIALVAMIVFIFMLFAVFTLVRSERKAKNVFRSRDDIESVSSTGSDAALLPEDATKNEGRPADEQKSSALAALSAEPFPEEKPKTARNSSPVLVRMFGWMPLLNEVDSTLRATLLRGFAFLFGGVLIFLAILPDMLQIQERIFHSMRQKGWTTYLQEFHDDESRTSCTPFVGVRKGEVLLDANGNIWVAGGCAGLAGLHTFDGRQWTSHPGNYFALAEGPDGQIWAVTGAGETVDVFDGQTWKTYPGQELVRNEYPMTRVEVDRDGRIWIVSRDDQANKIVDYINEITVSPEHIVSLKDSLPVDGYLSSFDSDPQGRIWAAVDRPFPKEEVTGMSVFDGTALQHLPDQRRNLNKVVGTALDPHGTLWVVTRCGSVLKYNSQAWISIVDQDTFTRCDPFQIQGMILDDQNRMWTWSYKRIQILDGDHWVSLTPENSGIEGERVFGLMIDGMDRVWIGSSGGVSVAALPDVQPLPGILVSWYRTLLYTKSWLRGMNWFLPSIVAILWLATYFNLLPGVLLAVVLGLLYLVIWVGVIRPGNAEVLVALTGVGATFAGILGGVIGGLLDRRQGTKSTRRALGMAVAGLILGGVFTFLFVFIRSMWGG